MGVQAHIAEDYGYPWTKSWSGFPAGIDFYKLSNEDVGFTATLVNGTNETYSYHNPFPSHIDLLDETTRIYQQAWSLVIGGQSASLDVITLAANIGYPDRDPDTTDFRGDLSDSEDEMWKSKLNDRLMVFGEHNSRLVVTAATEPENGILQNQTARYTSPVPLDQMIPMQVDLIGLASTYTLVTNAQVDLNFAFMERFSQMIWYILRNLTPAEKVVRNIALRFLRIES